MSPKIIGPPIHDYFIFQLLLNNMIERPRIIVSISSIMCTIYATDSSFLATFFILLLIK